MDVFVIPIGSDRYELYCDPSADAASSAEPGESSEQPAAKATSGWLWRGWTMLRATRAAVWAARLIDRRRLRFANALEAAERGEVPEPGTPEGWRGRLQTRMMAWMAERIAEQRLLWRLRRQKAAVAVYPQDMSFEQVMTLITRTLQRDSDRHRLWLIIHAAGMVLSWPLVFVPGPNLLLYYFMIRVGGHWLSMGGARQGMRRVAWTGRPCPPLTELRGASTLDPTARDRCVGDVAARLRLPYLSRFFERVAVPHA